MASVINLNTRRRNREEALRRRVHRDRAARLADVRPQFQQWMRDHGIPDEQQVVELERLQEHVDFNQMMADEGDVD